MGYPFPFNKACSTCIEVSITTTRYILVILDLTTELLNVTPASHSDFDALELATKEIAKVAERINVLNHFDSC